MDSADIQDRRLTRTKLKKEKPIVHEKLIQLDHKLAQGQVPPPVIEIAYRYSCNLNCKHCFAKGISRKERSLNLSDLDDLTRQAMELGVYQFILQGGEPLFWQDLDDIIKALRPKEFYLGLVTNATLLTHEKLLHLRILGIDKIVISLDFYDAHKYEENRNKTGLFEHTIKMLFKAKEIGLRVIINTVATKQNVRSPELLKLIDFAKENGFIVYVNFAAPIGNWEGRYDLLLNESDADYIYSLNLQHEVIKRDIYPYRGIKVPCPALKSIVYITQYGDVLPCPFIHISAGNTFEKPLSRIIEDGLRVKWFSNPIYHCLASEDMDFIRKVSQKNDKSSPLAMNEVFHEEECASRKVRQA